MECKDVDRVRCCTCAEINKKIDVGMITSLKKYSVLPKAEISARIIELEKQWSIERRIELSASILAFIGVILGAFVHIFWLLFPILIISFLALHAIQGWCPPIPFLRKLNIRTRREIDWEKFALKFIRGDFENLTKTDITKIFDMVKKSS
ncbi:MAG: hypothetical protein H0T62_09710 [Parachlamydiaceae bacterium]|nr:hypothetical protein [Parachlamydiaceae bacterium]